MIVLIKALFFVTCVLTLTSLLTWMERKQSPSCRTAWGPTGRPSWESAPSTAAHSRGRSENVFQGGLCPSRGRPSAAHGRADCGAVFALMSFAAIPFGNSVQIAGRTVELQILPLNVGLLFVFAMMSMGIYGTFLAGFSSDNKFAFSAGCVLEPDDQLRNHDGSHPGRPAHDLRHAGPRGAEPGTGRIAVGMDPPLGHLPSAARLSALSRGGFCGDQARPFDLPEGESEIIGYFLEYSSMKFGAFS